MQGLYTSCSINLIDCFKCNDRNILLYLTLSAMPSQSEKNIVITGCSSGIGACLATGLKQRGYRVIASCRFEQDVSRLEQQGHETIRLDLADPASVERASQYIAENCADKVYGLINSVKSRSSCTGGAPGAGEVLCYHADQNNGLICPPRPDPCFKLVI
jgi:NADPH:quinone reductase-like Zn-dependent oxidoreductase